MNSSNLEPQTSNIERRIEKRSYGVIFRANLPVEVFRTERPIRRFISRFFGERRQS